MKKQTSFSSLLRVLALAASASICAIGAASAHRMWITPSAFTLSGEEQWITVDGAISNDLFFANHVPLTSDALIVTRPDGQSGEIENAATGRFRTVFDVQLNQQGTYRIAETGALFFAEWQENGETQRRRGSLEQLRSGGVLAHDGVRLMRSARRVETYVTLGAPNETALRPTGQGLELRPLTHPNDIFAGEPARFVLLQNGEPAAGLQVEIVKGDDRYADAVQSQTLTSAADGSISFTPQQVGRYWLASQAEGVAEMDGVPMRQLLTYTLTFEVVQP